jgi:hypothetical protein
VLVLWIFREVQSEEFEFANARVGGLGPEDITLES